jgi:flagellar biosynthesis protein FlhF
MEPISFKANSAEEAVNQIRAQLGPEAVVLNVRRLPANGLARLWQKPMIEVLAHLQQSSAAAAAEMDPVSETLAAFRQQLDEIKQQVVNRPGKLDLETPIQSAADLLSPTPEASAPDYNIVGRSRRSASEEAQADEAEEALHTGKWRVGAMLQKSGLSPLHTQRVLDQLHARHGENPPRTLAEEISLAQAVLAKFWRPAAPIKDKSLHVLIGPAGSGKTTLLCKWLTQTVLMESRTARVWRLDSAVANTAESLSVYCDILGAPSERLWETGSRDFTEDLGFIDVPGVDWRKPIAVKELAGYLKQFGSPKIHLVLNGAYDLSILLAQTRAFAHMPIEDLIVTHLDEETRWGKLWNLVLGTNYSVRCFSTGQNIPGDFCEASPEMIFSRQFPRK